MTTLWQKLWSKSRAHLSVSNSFTSQCIQSASAFMMVRIFLLTLPPHANKYLSPSSKYSSTIHSTGETQHQVSSLKGQVVALPSAAGLIWVDGPLIECEIMARLWVLKSINLRAPFNKARNREPWSPPGVIWRLATPLPSKQLDRWIPAQQKEHVRNLDCLLQQHSNLVDRQSMHPPCYW